MTNFSPEHLLAHMTLSVKTLDRAYAIAIYQEMSPELVLRLKHECLTRDEGKWLDDLINSWKSWKEKRI